jgi:hypothetical protein
MVRTVLGFEGHIQQTERLALLAADPEVNLVGFSDGPLRAGMGIMVVIVGWLLWSRMDGNILQGDVLAGGGGAALAADTTNVLLSSTRMEALGLAARWHVVCQELGGQGRLVY